MTVRERISQGEFEGGLKWPSSVVGPERTEAMKAYRRAESEARERFRKALAEEHGVVGHPKEPRLFEIAWSHGHANGLIEVVVYYEEFVELLR